MAELTLHLQVREEQGKNKVDKLRNEKRVPGVFYAKGEENISVSAAENELNKVVLSAGTSALVDAEINGKITKVLFKDVQMHPFKNQILHFDIYGVNLKEKLRINIPVVLEARDEIRVQPSVLLQHLEEVEVEVLPTNLPSEAVVNVMDMQIGDNILVKDLDVASIEGIDVLTDLEEVVATLSEPREEVIAEEGEGEEETAEVPVVGEEDSADEE
ncbi:MAG: 50S ribosomal protein L25 [Tissierellia bacterium]|nr:50S ribosomal protein L25 [Tissierellia bacterium]